MKECDNSKIHISSNNFCFMLRPLYLKGKKPCYPVITGLGGSQRNCEGFGKGNALSLCQKLNHGSSNVFHTETQTRHPLNYPGDSCVLTLCFSQQ